jgi:hypothetical protein
VGARITIRQKTNVPKRYTFTVKGLAKYRDEFVKLMQSDENIDIVVNDVFKNQKSYDVYMSKRLFPKAHI